MVAEWHLSDEQEYRNKEGKGVDKRYEIAFLR